MKHAEIIFKLVGSEGQLDLPERDYAVYYLDDIPKEIQIKIDELKKEYSNYGWSLITAHRIIPEKEVQDILGERR